MRTRIALVDSTDGIHLPHFFWQPNFDAGHFAAGLDFFCKTTVLSALAVGWFGRSPEAEYFCISPAVRWAGYSYILCGPGLISSGAVFDDRGVPGAACTCAVLIGPVIWQP